jgi:hypothetical protein
MKRLEPICAQRECRCVLVDETPHGRPIALALALADERGVDRQAALESASSTRWTW